MIKNTKTTDPKLLEVELRNNNKWIQMVNQVIKDNN